MPDAHAVAIKAAERTSKTLSKLFASVGGAAHPKGAIMRHYRVARFALAGLERTSPSPRAAVVQVGDILQAMRTGIESDTARLLDQAKGAGERQALENLDAYGETPEYAPPYDTAPAISAIMAGVDAQISQATAIVASGGDWANILGDDERAGLLQPAPVVRDETKWLTLTAILALIAMIEPRAKKFNWQKQVIASIDGHTTDCCLRAHGQVQPFNRPFQLVGTPRFADQMTWTPFHWYCRSSVVMLPVEDAEDDLTQRMRDLSAEELRARAETGRPTQRWTASGVGG